MSKIIDIITKVREQVHILEFLSSELEHNLIQKYFVKHYGEVNIDDATKEEIQRSKEWYEETMKHPKAIVDGYDYIFKAMEMCTNHHERDGKHTKYSIENWYTYAHDVNLVYLNERNIKKTYKNVATHFNFL